MKRTRNNILPIDRKLIEAVGIVPAALLNEYILTLKRHSNLTDFHEKNRVKINFETVKKSFQITSETLKSANEILIEKSFISISRGSSIVSIHFNLINEIISNHFISHVQIISNRADINEMKRSNKGDSDILSFDNISSLYNNFEREDRKENISLLQPSFQIENKVKSEMKNANEMKSETIDKVKRVKRGKNEMKNKQDEKLSQFKPLAEYLCDIIKTKKQINITPSRVESWTQDISRLCIADKVSKTRIRRVLHWYGKHIGEPFVPVVESGRTLREKFLRLESAMERDENGFNVTGKKPPKILSAGEYWYLNIMDGCYYNDEGKRLQDE